MIICVLLVAVAAFPCRADLTIKRETTLGNFMGLGSTKSTEIQYIKGDKSCDETSTEFTGGLMKMTTGGKTMHHSQIVRLDRQLIWNIEPDEKKYSELSFAKFKQMMEQTMKQAADPQLGDENDYDWKTEVKVRSGKENVNGFDCRLIEGISVGVNKKKPADTVTINIKYWHSQSIPGAGELNKFQENFAKAVGLDEFKMQQGLQTLTQAYGRQFAELLEKMKGETGTLVRSVITVEQSGKNDKDDLSENDVEDDDVKAPSQLLGKIGKLAGKSQKSDEKSAKTTLFSATTDLKSIDTKPIDDGKFEIPAGFAKKELK